MDRLLIVEDEALIRKGLRAIVERSGVPIGEILECKDGEEALAVLAGQKVDVMFTDVRMPQMDGLTLLHNMAELPRDNRPEVVVISGHDDFNYAVEAMRHGSREYILKPVQRQRVFEVLEKLDGVVAQKKKDEVNKEKISQQQLKYILLNPNITHAEIEAIQDTFKDLLTGEVYVLFCVNKAPPQTDEDVATRLDPIGPFHILVQGTDGKKEFIAHNLTGLYAGISSPHASLGDFKTAFGEAVVSRKHAFYTSKPLVEGGGEWPGGAKAKLPIPPSGAAGLARRVGTVEYASLIRLLNKVFDETARECLPPYLVEDFLQQFFTELEKLYPNMLAEGAPRQLREIYSFDTVEVYRLALAEWLDGLHVRVNRKAESSRNNERMEKALGYLHEHYAEGLNMAVVSNHFGMNYSVFSQLFKDYAGKSFVDYLRDLRIEKAKELLAQSEQKISDISAAVGYENDKYFMKSFKDATGVSPSQYRRTEQVKRMDAERG